MFIFLKRLYRLIYLFSIGRKKAYFVKIKHIEFRDKKSTKDAKGVIKIRKSENNRQNNGQKKKKQ